MKSKIQKGLPRSHLLLNNCDLTNIYRYWDNQIIYIYVATQVLEGRYLTQLRPYRTLSANRSRKKSSISISSKVSQLYRIS